MNNSKTNGQHNRLNDPKSSQNQSSRNRQPHTITRNRTGSSRVQNTSFQSFQSFSSQHRPSKHDPNNYQQLISSLISYNDNHNQSSSIVQQQLQSICWSNNGSKLATASTNSLIIYNSYPESGLKQCSRRKLYDDANILQMKYLQNNHTVVTMAANAVKFWDCRSGKMASMQQLLNHNNTTNNNQEQNQPWALFGICNSKNIITVGDYYTIKNYDYRMLDKYQCQPISSVISDIPINDIKWCELGDNILITGGGHSNKGIITLYDQQLNELYQMQQCANQIISLSLSQTHSMNNTRVNDIMLDMPYIATLSQQNTIQILQLPQLTSYSTISLTEQQIANRCQINSTGQYVTAVYDKYIYIVDIWGQSQGEYHKRKQYKDKEKQRQREKDRDRFVDDRDWDNAVQQQEQAKSYQQYDKMHSQQQPVNQQPKINKPEINKYQGQIIKIKKKTNVCWNPTQPDILAYIDRQYSAIPKLYHFQRNKISKQASFF